MKVYFIVRFSIMGASEFKLTHEKSRGAYRRQLFATKRLDAKFQAFEMVTLPSLINQTNKDFECLIFTSPQLPDKYKQRLLNLVQPHNNIKVEYVDDSKGFQAAVEGYQFGNHYATVRLDDDDGLSTNYVELLQQYADKDQHIVSFPLGYRYKIQSNSIVKSDRVCDINNIALGLAAINRNIFRCGNHSNVHRENQVIYDRTPDMYLLFCSKHCDTKRKFV